MAVSDPHVIAEFMNSLEKKLDILRESYAENGGSNQSVSLEITYLGTDLSNKINDIKIGLDSLK